MHEGRPQYWFRDELLADLQGWMASVANLLRILATPDTYFLQECERILTDEKLRHGVSFHVVQKLVGLLASLLEEIEHGLLRKAEYIFVASTFDEFLDHAAEYHRGGKKLESSVLVSAVFEDAIRKLATKSDIAQAGVSLDAIIDALVRTNVFTLVKGKRLKGYAALRNKALHAQWDEFDLRDVGQMITATREILEAY
jgi:hypothetical protein